MGQVSCEKKQDGLLNSKSPAKKGSHNEKFRNAMISSYILGLCYVRLYKMREDCR